MGKFSILHLSDLHWAEEKKGDMRIVIEGLLNDLTLLKKEKGIRPDLLVFSGDLVRAGEEDSAFQNAYDEFLLKVLEHLNLHDNRLFIIPGNHDCNRKITRESGYVEQGLLASLHSTDSINRFVDDVLHKHESVRPALARLANYEKFQDSRIQKKTITSNSLLKTYKIKVDEVDIGVACFNTAWRATGEPDDRDRRNIILGERNVDTAISDLSDSHFRIAIYHHPLDWLVLADEASVSSRLLSQFDLLMCGHVHQPSPEAKLTGAGSALLSQCGCIFEHRNYFNGYQLIEVDTQKQEANFIIRTWFDAPRREFDSANNIVRSGELTLPYTPRNIDAVSKSTDFFLKEVRAIIRENASSHINIADSRDLKLGAKEAFICPPLRIGRHELNVAESVKENEGEQLDDDDDDEQKETQAEELLKGTDDVLIIGGRDTGKTSLAHYMAVLAAEGVIDRVRIPVVFDFRANAANIYGHRKAIATYFGVTKSGLDVDVALKQGDFLFLVDNFSGVNAAKKKSFEEFQQKFPDNRWIAFSDRRFRGTDKENNENDLFRDCQIIQIGNLPRHSIRELTARWSSQTGADSNELFKLIMSQIKVSALPRSGYIVTLLLWAFYQDKRFERINEAVLLSNMLDHLLGKADFTQALHGQFDAVSKEITLQSIARFFRERGGSVEKNEAVGFVIAFFQQKGLKHSASNVLDGLIGCGILTEADGKVSFKYRCFEEYFFAQLIRNDDTLRSKVLSDLSFLEYSRELELLSGLTRQNSEIIAVLSGVLLGRRPPEVQEAINLGFEKVADQRRAVEISFDQIADIRKKRLTARQIDDMVDATDRKLSKRKSQRRPKSPKTDGGDQGGLRAAAGEAAVQDGSFKPAGALNEKGGVEVGVSEPGSGRQDSIAEPISPRSFMSTVTLLGQVVRNSEFSDARDKLTATKLYIESLMGVYLLYTELLSEVMEDVVNKRIENDEVEKNAELNMINYFFKKLFLVLLLGQASEEIGTIKLSGIYDSIFDNKESSLFERLIVGVIKFDLMGDDWVKRWRELIDRHKKDFLLDTMIDKIWHTIHTKYLLPHERDKIEKITDDLERALGRPKSAKGKSFERLRDTIRNTNKRLDGEHARGT